MPKLTASEPVEIPADILAEIEAMPKSTMRYGYQWTPLQDAVLVKCRNENRRWDETLKLISSLGESDPPSMGCARARYRELTDG